uniref:Uncharacterized protein n=1 Tax=Anguilla anguilla TaxID=7936 RepID=A0A0E9WJG6_ANGAN
MHNTVVDSVVSQTPNTMFSIRCLVFVGRKISEYGIAVPVVYMLGLEV